MRMEPVLLGLSTGTYCIMICAPVALPFLFSHELTPKRNAIVTSLFILGRLFGYVLSGILLGALGAYASSFLDPDLKHRLASAAFVLLGLVMTAEGLLLTFPHLSFCRKIAPAHRPETNGLLYGFFTALNLCPPFFAAASRVFANGGGMLEGAAYFFLFFLGTSVYLTPLFGIPLLGRAAAAVRPIARITLILLGAYFLVFAGLFQMITGGRV